MNKQIEEMANDLAKICPDLVENGCGQVNCITHLTLSLSKIGYRKASDVVREIFEEIERHIEDVGFSSFVERSEFKDWLAELKKKYESEKEE